LGGGGKGTQGGLRGKEMICRAGEDEGRESSPKSKEGNTGGGGETLRGRDAVLPTIGGKGKRKVNHLEERRVLKNERRRLYGVKKEKNQGGGAKGKRGFRKRKKLSF